MQNCITYILACQQKFQNCQMKTQIQLNLQLIMTIRTSVRIQSFYVFGIAYVFYTTILSQFNLRKICKYIGIAM